MSLALDPAAIRALAERFIRIPSVSPDVFAETEFARALLAEIPVPLERGEWRVADGRPVVWARVRGSVAPPGPRRAVLLLAHYDTVGVGEFATLGLPAGERAGFDPPALRNLFLSYTSESLPPGSHELLEDLAEEKRRPGTWMFGRGAADMKSALAVALAVMASLADDPALAGDVLLVVCPDEEHASAGMLAAVGELARLREDEGLELAGALNLDYACEPVAYAGVMGKALAGIYVIGRPTHAGTPFEGVDAAQLAAAIVSRATASRGLVDQWEGITGVPPVALRLRDLKAGYNVQTAVEAEVELNLLTFARPLAETLEALRTEALAALEDLARAMRELRAWVEPGHAAHGGEDLRSRVLLWPELVARAGEPGELFDSEGRLDPRAASLMRVRKLVRAARLAGPAVVIHLLPPFHPHAAPGDGPLVRAARSVLAGEGIEVRPFYPYITDASYVAWRGEPPEALATFMPSYGQEYRLPIQAMRALDLDVVNLGPWGRDAHGLFERVRADWAFWKLPGVLAEVMKGALAPPPR